MPALRAADRFTVIVAEVEDGVANSIPIRTPACVGDRHHGTDFGPDLALHVPGFAVDLQ